MELFSLFEGISIGTESETVKNGLTGVSYELTAEEVAVYDVCMGAQLTAEFFGLEEAYEEVQKCISWFIKNNPSAYMALLD